MAAPQPTQSSVQPAPVMPALQAEPALSNYLRSIVLWVTQQLQERQSNLQALPFILLQQSDATPGTTPKVFKVTIDSAGALHAVAMTLGQAP
jgi:hypothetical protein